MPACQQQVLDRIENHLENCEPRLRSMFAIFTRLTRDEGAPRTESLHPQGPHHRRAWPHSGSVGTLCAVIAIPLVLCLVAVFVFLAISGAAAPGCRAGAGSHATAAVRTTNCQSMTESSGR